MPEKRQLLEKKRMLGRLVIERCDRSFFLKKKRITLSPLNENAERKTSAMNESTS